MLTKGKYGATKGIIDNSIRWHTERATESSCQNRFFKTKQHGYVNANACIAEGVKEAMRQCGYIDIVGYDGDRDSSINDHAQRENCMFKNGFKYKGGYRGLCASIERKNLPACQSNAE